ncbi:hypothetical protein L195_g011787 [Trifolium pratense]|uniref:Uncharacterized protein n=1 Tax=Trifolium pratense TaxID=57577 RepID=A0A2K3JLQ3_TRIPR|nr:hypothetical protein L195_g048583 [Trifolium pratense]PNX73523.1 hypothetical protein L195_g029425 [Trifolium pratense]PNY15097.1 hypothetical protein L195_g011787 [Trifolium pratense]
MHNQSRLADQFGRGVMRVTIVGRRTTQGRSYIFKEAAERAGGKAVCGEPFTRIKEEEG